MKFHCYCENTVEIDIKDEYLLDDETIASITNGDFLSVKCSKCGKILKPEFELQFKTTSKTKYCFIPENERYSYFEQNTVPDDVYCIIGYQELIELIAITKNKLKSEVVELLKLQIIQKVPDPSEVIILLDNLISNELVFHIHGLKENEIGVMKIPISIYNKIEADLPQLLTQEPYNTIIQKPYISLRKHIEQEVAE